MSVTQQPVQSKWQRAAQIGRSFVGLAWYDETIDFLFKFVAKTSEPLLAAGLVVSAADFLSDGQVMQNNPTLALTWSWTQAIAIETSAGVTLVYAFQSIRGHDKPKVWIYSILAALLALVGITMLFLQLMAHSLGIGETHITSAFSWLPFAMSALRSIVAVGYVVMCRTKNINFSSKGEDVPTPLQSVPNVTKDELDKLRIDLDTTMMNRLDGIEQSFMRAVTQIREHASHQGGTQISEVREQTDPELPAIGNAHQFKAFPTIPATGDVDAQQRLETLWLTLTDEEKTTITGNDLYNRVGKRMRKQTAYDFLSEKRAEMQEVAV